MLCVHCSSAPSLSLSPVVCCLSFQKLFFNNIFHCMQTRLIRELVEECMAQLWIASGLSQYLLHPQQISNSLCSAPGAQNF